MNGKRDGEDADEDTLRGYYRDLKAHNRGKAKAAEKRRLKEGDAFEENKRLALQHGYILQWHSESHFQITRRGAWTLNLYPGNQRIYRGKERHAPYLELPTPWTIRDVIIAAAKKEAEHGSVDSLPKVHAGIDAQGRGRVEGGLRSDVPPDGRRLGRDESPGIVNAPGNAEDRGD